MERGREEGGEKAGQKEEGKRRVPPSVLSLFPSSSFVSPWNERSGGIEVNTNKYQSARYPVAIQRISPLLP